MRWIKMNQILTMINDLCSMPWALKDDVLSSFFNIMKASDPKSFFFAAAKKQKLNYSVIDNVAHIPLVGVFMRGASSWGDSVDVDEVITVFDSALADSAVRKIVFDIDSPGGSASGVAELAEHIYTKRGVKPIEAHTSGLMASAAYWVAAAANKIICSSSAHVGSIGVYMVSWDYSRMLDNAGIKAEIIKAGEYKAAGHPAKPLDDASKAVMQENVDDLYTLFIESVAKYRGINVDEVLKFATGRVFVGKRAFNVGLVDSISGCVSQTSKNLKTKTEEVGGMEISEISKDQLQAGNPELYKAIQAEGAASVSVDDAAKEAVAKETERCVEIFEHATTEFAGMGMEATALAAVKAGKSFDAALADIRGKRLEDLQANANPSPGAGPDADEIAEHDQALETVSHTDKARAYQKEHGGSMVDAFRATK